MASKRSELESVARFKGYARAYGWEAEVEKCGLIRISPTPEKCAYFGFSTSTGYQFLSMEEARAWMVGHATAADALASRPSNWGSDPSVTMTLGRGSLGLRVEDPAVNQVCREDA